MIELIDAIRISNDCSKKDAENILQDEMDTCRDLLSDGDLTMCDLEQACFDMGIDLDHIEQMLEYLC